MVFFFRKTDRKFVPEAESLKRDYDKLMKLFKDCDVNKDGKLSWEEVKAGFQKLHSRFPLYRTHRAFQMADRNGDGYINASDEELHKLITYALDCYEGDIQNKIP